MDPTCEALALRHAVWALAAPTCHRLFNGAVTGFLPVASDEYFYTHARSLLNTADSEPSELASLCALQAVVLIGFYELRRARFSKAWLTAHRAVWLAQSLGLHTLDSHCPPKTAHFDVQEARQTFWAAHALKCFLSLGNTLPDIASAQEVGPHLIAQHPDHALTKLPAWGIPASNTVPGS